MFLFFYLIALVHKPEIDHFFGSIALSNDVIARRQLQDFVHAKIVVGKCSGPTDLYIERVEDAGVQDLANGRLSGRPISENVLELWHDFIHLCLDQTHIFI